MGFYAVLKNLRDTLAAPRSLTVAAAREHYGRAAKGPEITKGTWKGGVSIPTLRIHGVDEDAITAGNDRAAMGAALPTCQRLVEVAIAVPLDRGHVEKLEALTDGVIADLHKARITGAKRTAYAGLRDPGEEETRNETERVLAFWVTYAR